MTKDEANRKVQQFAQDEPIQFFLASCVASYLIGKVLRRVIG